MSIHHSLKTNTNAPKRSVRKRYERLRSLMLKNKWDKKHSSIYALPKEKIVRLKIKKEKKEEKDLTLVEYAKETEEKVKKKSKDNGKRK